MFGPYRVERLIGKGGMGAVYEAIHTQIERRAAIKVLSSQLARDATIATRFLNEARAVNIVSHPSLVNIYEFGQLEDGTAYIVMEYLEGETLHSRMHSLGAQGMDHISAMQIIRQIASGLAEAHAKRIVHRDLKPGNIMLVPDPETPSGERVKILDFGIAQILDGKGDEQRLTNTDTLMGTPTYMSPEQCRSAREVTDRSDVYSLGVLAYELLTGTQPFRGRNDIDSIMRHKNLTPPSIREKQPAVPMEVDALVLQMLAKNPLERPSTAEVKQTLGQILRHTSISSLSGAIPSPPLNLTPTSQPNDRTALQSSAGSLLDSNASETATVVSPPMTAPSFPRAPQPEDGLSKISLRTGKNIGVVLAVILVLIIAALFCSFLLL